MIEYETFMAKCPHCGAPVTEKRCPYCWSMLGSFAGDEKKNQVGTVVGYESRTASFVSYDPVLKGINRCADDILSAYSKKSDAVYDIMEKYQIGHSEYGRLMDKAGKGKHTMAHRLYGHHILYDFPINNPNQILAFLEHLLSDSFTKMGLPILPGDILEDVGMLKWCNSLEHNWNFVNGFDVLSGTVALIQGIQSFQKCFSQEGDDRSARSLAMQIGIGTFELLIAASTYNPFLLIGSLLTMTSGMAGFIRKGTRAHIEYNRNRLIISC